MRATVGNPARGLVRAAKGLKSIMGPDMDRVGSLADWGGDKQPPRESSPRPFPGF